MIRVLYVDNEPALLDVCQCYLERDPEFEIEIETSGITALSRICWDSYDAIVSDYDMPGMNGIEFLHSVREKNPSIPFIIFSSKGREELIIQSLNEGADFYVQKGADIRAQYAELAHKIRQAVVKNRTVHALIESEERFRALTEQSPDIIIRIDASFRILYANPRISVLSETRPDEYLGSDLRDVTPLQFVMKAWEEEIRNVFFSGRPSELQCEITAGSWLDCLFFPEFSPEKEVTAVTCSLRDISSRRAAEKEREDLLDDLISQGEFINALLNALPIPVHYKDNTLRYSGCNRAFTVLTGITEEELIGKQSCDIWPANEAALCESTDTMLIREGQLTTHTTTITDRSGRVHDIIHSKNLFHDHQGNVAGIVGAFQDMTNYNQLVKDLKSREELFRMIVNQSSDLFIILTPDLEISYISPGIEHLAGFLAEEVTGHITRFLHPDDLEESVRLIQMLFDRPDTYMNAEFRAVTRTGSYILYEGTAINCIDNPAIHGILVTARDITLRRHIEERLAQTRAFIQNLIDSAPVMIAIIDSGGRISLFNHAFADFFHSQKNDLIGMMARDLLPPEMIDIVMPIVARILQGLDTETSEFRVKRPENEIFLSTIFFPIEDNGIIMAGFIGMDVTETRQIMGELSRKYEENELLEELVRKRTEEVTWLLDQKNLLLTRIAHDLRTPLTPLTWLIPDLRTSESDPYRREVLEILERNAIKMASIVDKILHLTRLGTMSEIPDLQLVSLMKIMEQIITQYSVEAEIRGCRIVSTISTDLMVHTSPGHMESVFENILSNSVKYSHDGGEILISGEDCDGSIVITISDNGIGLSEYDLIHIFEPFFKGDHSRHDRDSSGLSLSITKRLVEALGGTIYISSKGLGEGTQVTLTFRKNTVEQIFSSGSSLP